MEINNLGVALQQMDMPITAAFYYKEAIDKGNTLSSANLARVMLKSGLVVEAKQVLDAALSLKDSEGEAVEVDDNVHEAHAVITRAEEEERERMIRIVEASRLERQLFLASMEKDQVATTILRDDEFLGEWDTNFGKLTFAKEGPDYSAAFKTDDLWDWSLSGGIDRKRRTFTFRWSTNKHDYRRPDNDEGTGYFVFRENTFEGFLRNRPDKGEVMAVTGRHPSDTP
ncbi:MAG: hypothetical protein WEC75_08635 [Dehalococcoidia bacterium]